MKKTFILLVLSFVYNSINAQTEKTEFIGYVVVNSETKDKKPSVYISEITKCYLPKDSNKQNTVKYQFGAKFRSYVVEKYNLGYSSGPSPVFTPIRMEKTTATQYRSAINLYGKTHKVIVIEDSEYQLECDKN